MPALDNYACLEIVDDLNHELCPNAASTYFVRVSDKSNGPDICDGDVLVVDHNLPACPGDIIVCFLDKKALVKRLRPLHEGCELHCVNEKKAMIHVADDARFFIFGVVTYIIHRARARKAWNKKCSPQTF